MTTSPYAGKPESTWLSVTQQLVNNHPLKTAELLDAATTAWATPWQTTVGTGSLSVKLSDLKVPATIVGYFFEVLLARELDRGSAPQTAQIIRVQLFGSRVEA